MSASPGQRIVTLDAFRCFTMSWLLGSKPIKEIRLHGTSGFRSANGKPAAEIALILDAVSITPKRLALARSKP